MEHRSNCACPADAPGYEDSYGGWEHPSFDSLLACFVGNCAPGSPFAALNLPIWIDYNANRGEVLIGVFLPRHGDSAIWSAPATNEQANQIREIMADIWIGRIDAGLPRYRD